ncbi:MAG: response regulator [Capsulimonadaceae bacterium]
MRRPLRVLLVEDSPADAKLILRELDRAGFEVDSERVETRDAMISALDARVWDVILSDFRLPLFSGSDALTLVREMGLDVPFIIVSGTVGETNAVAAMKAGANDYVMKDNPARLASAITRELQDAVVRQKHREAEAEQVRVREENERLLREMAAVAIQQRSFLRDILYAVTEGKLILCGAAYELPDPAANQIGPFELARDTIRLVRVTAREAAAALGFPDDRCTDIETAVGEAAMNAIVHGGGGRATICADDGWVRVYIEDNGQGIDLTTLPRATLERGFTTKGSLGHGFFMMICFVDCVYLLTGPTGTTVVLEQNRVEREPVWLQRAGEFAASAYEHKQPALL